VQEVFNYYGVGGEFNIGKFYDDAIGKAEAEIEPQLGMELVEMSEEAIAEFQAKVDEAADAYAAENGTEAILARYRELLEEYNVTE